MEPLMIERKKKIDLSFFTAMDIIPVKEEPILETAATNIGIESLRLLKKTFPPLFPE